MNALSTRGLILLSILLLQFDSIGQLTPKNSGSPSQTISYATTVGADGYKRCGTMEADSLLRAANPGMPSLYQEEMWLQQKIQEYKANQAAKIAAGYSAKATLLTIPVVVHVIHNGDAVGVNENIADAQVISQIQVLNEDFRRMFGTPGYNTHVDGADIEVEFCLAVVDELGNPHSGIDRVNYGQAAFTGQTDANTMKAATYWNPDDYMNMWTVNYGGSGLLGFAQFPNSSGLGGLNANNGGATTDGVVADYRSFGSSAIYPAGTYNAPYDLGRTMTHEIGHYLGLRHIWGDANCGNDFCADTPESTTSNGGCPTQTTCDGIQDMVENYMDYTNDACMDIFTDDQKTRIRTVFTVCPRRLSLTTSTKCTPANPDDIGVYAVNSPTGIYCASSFVPDVDVKNYGNNNVTSFTLFYDIDGGGTQSYLWTGTLTPGQTVNVVLPSMSPAGGPHVFNAYTDIPNGNVDPYSPNDANLSNFTMVVGGQVITLDLEVDCYGDEITWEVQDAGSNVVYSGGPYAVIQNGEDVLVDMCLTVGCYDFIINDTYGDGMAGDGVGGCIGDGTYSITDAGSNVLASIQNVDFGNQEINNFCVTSACDDPDVPTLTYAPATICDGDNATLTITGNLDDATDWYVYTGSCGGTVVGTTNTSTIVVAPGAPSTTYYVRGEGGCVVPGTCGSVAVTVDPIEDASFSYGVAAYCSDASDPTPTITGVGSGTFTSVPAGLSINSSTGVIDVSASTPNSYTVTYTTPGTCSGNSNVAVTINALPATPTILASGPTTFCAGGSVDLTSSQASGNVWSTTETTQNINVTGTGSYTVTYTDGNGCSATSAPTAVTVNAIPAIPIITPDGPTTFCTGGSVNLTSSQASGNVWSTTETTQTIIAAGTGNYSVTYTDGNGCSSTSAITAVTLNADPAPPTITAGGSTTFCAGGSVNLISSQASGNVWSTTETTQTISAVSTGAYSVTYTDGNGCSATSAITNVTVNANPAVPTITPDGPTTFCTGGSVNLTSSQASGNVWSTTETTQTINAAATGNYSVTYTDGNGCSSTSAITAVTLNADPAPPTITAGGPTTFCAGSSVNLTSSQASGNVWSTTETTQTINVTGTGAYSVIYTDGNGCSSTSSVMAVTVNANPATPTITTDGPTTFCAGGSVNLTSSQASGNVWSTTETTQTINITGTGAYSVTYTDGNGCSATSAITNVTVNANPVIPTITPDGPTTFCTGGSVNLTSSQASGNVWSTTETTQTINAAATGNYSVTYMDGNGCSSTSAITSVTLNADPAPPSILAGGPTTFCAGGSVDLTSSQASGNVWSTAETTQTINVVGTGSYTVTYTDGNGCSSISAPTVVTVNANPAVPTITPDGPTTFCAGGSVNLTSSQASGNVWSTTETTQIINAAVTGNYSVTYTNGNGCSSTSAITAVTMNANPAAPTISAAGPTTFCAGGSVNLTSSQASGNVWSTTETTQTINVIGTGAYSVAYTDGNGCSSVSAITNVTVNPNPAIPTISAGGPTTFCAGGSVTLTSSQGSGNVWSTTSTSNNIIVTTGGPYTVTYTDGNGCSAISAVTNVTVNPSPVIAIGTVLDPNTCATATGSIQITGAGTGVVSWTGTATGNSGSVALPYTITGLAAGSYNITFDDGCGSNLLNQTLTDPTPPAVPIITAGGTTTFCAGGSVVLTSSYGSGNTWSTTETTSSINVGTSSTVSVTYTDGSGCSSSSAPIVITVNVLPATPTISPDGPTTFCSGGSVNLSSSQASGNDWSTTETTQIINISTAGPYSVTYTDGNGCSSTSAVTNITVNATPAAPTITAGGPTTFCAGGSVDLTSSQASGNDWSTTETTQTITVNSTGTYTVTYTAGNGCTATSAITNVTVNPVPVISIGGVTNPTTCGTNTGSIQVSGTGTGIVNWAGTASGNSGSVTLPYSITGLGAGPYTVTFDESGCTSNVIAPTLADPTPPATPTIVASGPTTFCAGGSVDLTSSYTSGNVWTTAATTQAITVNSTGMYSVTYTDGSGCSSTSAPVSITVNSNPAAPTISAGGPTTFCAGGSVDLTSSQASGNVWSTTETTQIINVSTAGPYSVTYTDGNGCSSSSTVTNITVNATPAVPIISASGSTTFCAGGSVDLTSSQASGNVWSTTETTQIINVTSTGAYSVIYTDGNGCSATSAITNVTVNATPAVPTITASGPTTFCAGGSVGLTSSQAFGNDWSTTETTQTITVSTAGPYSVTYTDGNGCSSTSAPVSITINSNPPTPVVTANGPLTFCAGGSVDLTSSQASGNDWSTTETTQTINVTATGAYSVTYTDGNGCSASSAPTLVTVNIPLGAPNIIASGPLSFCDGGSVDLTSSYSSGNDWSTTETTQSINVASTGTYSVTYTDGNGCTSTSLPVSVTVNAIPSAPVITAGGPLTFCDGGSVDLTSSQASGNNWSTTETTQTVNIISSGTYDVTYTDGNGCSAISASVVVTVNAIPATPNLVASGPTTFCAGGSVDLTSSQASGNVWSTSETTQSINVTGTGSYTVTFTDGNGCSSTSAPVSVTVNATPSAPVISASGPLTFCDGGSVDLTSDQASNIVWSSTETTQTINVIASGSYDVTYTDVNGCSSTSASAVVTVNVIPASPIITASGPTTFCEGGSVDLTSSQASGNNWSTTETTQAIAASTSGSYSVTYTDGNGCSATSTPITVVVNPLPTVALGTYTAVCDHVAAFSLSGGSPAGGTYSGAGVSGGVFDPSIAGIGTHTITYDYTDGNGCTNSAQEDITVNDCTDLKEITGGDITVYPNPTSDNFVIETNGSPMSNVRIYDAAGKLVKDLAANSDQIQIDVSSFATGIYTVEVLVGSQYYRNRITKQ